MKKNDVRFKNFIEHIATKDITDVRKFVMYYCDISRTGYYKWLEGSSTPSIDRRVTINGIAFKFGYPIVYPNALGYRKQTKLIAVWKK